MERWGRAPPGRAVADQDLAAPDAAVRAVARAVAGQAHHGAAQAVLDHGADDVGVVVLHQHQVQALALGPAGGHVVRVQVRCQAQGLGPHQAAEPFLGRQEIAEGRGMGQVAQVLAQHGLPSLHQAEGALQVPAQGQHRAGRLKVQRQRAGHQAAGPAQRQQVGAAGFPAVQGHHHAVVHAPGDGPVVQQVPVGQAVQPGHGLVVLGAERLLAGVARGHHQGDPPSPAAAGAAGAWPAASGPTAPCPAPRPGPGGRRRACAAARWAAPGS